MARFRLRAPHYLNVPGTTWEYTEADQFNAKKQKKTQFPVPMFLHPDDPNDQNYPGEVIVATEESAQYPRDIVFVGPPTPDMEPIDEAAQALIQKYKKNWVHPIESLSGTYGDHLRVQLERELGAAKQEIGASMEQTLAAMQKQIESLTQQLAEKASAGVTRKV